jgi:hypothetical protein
MVSGRWRMEPGSGRVGRLQWCPPRAELDDTDEAPADLGLLGDQAHREAGRLASRISESLLRDAESLLHRLSVEIPEE